LTNAADVEKAEATQLETTPDSTLEGEAKEEVVTGESSESKEESTEETAEDVLQSYLKEKGLATDEAEGKSDEKKPEAADSSKVDVEAEIERRAQAVLQAERQRDHEEAQRQGVRRSFETRSERLRGFLYAKTGPLTPQEVEAVVQEFVQHHGQSSLVAREDASKELTTAYNDALFKAAEKHVSGITQEKFGNTAEFFSKFVEGARKGYVPEKDVEAKVKTALTDFKAYLDGKGITPGSKKVPGDSNNSTGARGKTPDSVLEDPTSSWEDRDKAFEKKYGFK
jgi:hypothetical protein